MTIRSRFIAPSCCLLLSLPGLASAGDTTNEWADNPTAATAGEHLRVSLLEARQGLEKIRSGEYSEASRFFNAALKFEPDNADLHFLNGLSYHLLYAQGHQPNRELADTAYNMALKLAPDHAPSAYQLGMLHMDARQYAKAQAAFAHALLLERDDPAVLRALSIASYYARDIGMALWAIRRVEQVQGPTPDTLRAAAIIYAAAGRPADAQERSELFRQQASPEAAEHVAKRVRHWLAFHESRKGRTIRTASLTVPLTPEALAEPAPDAPASPAEAAPSPAPVQITAGGAQPDAAGGDILRNWSDCPQGTTSQGQTYSQSYYSTAYDSSSFKDETVSLPALPSPCDRKTLPRMALLDTAIVSTYESNTTSKGINLLDGLRLLLGTSFTDTNEPAGGDRIKTFRRRAGFDNLGATTDTASAILGYSLNIANADNDWNQVLARPTLIALDRQPSTFFSGTSLGTTVQGVYSGGTFVEHPSGISLSVTPTFIDDESLLLSIRVARSFFASGKDLKKDTVTKARNAVSANVMMKMGETLILSGLTERQLNESKDGVPLLKDVPVLQYLFSNESKNDYTQSVLVMITPRPPVTGANAPLASNERGTDPLQLSSLKELRQQTSDALRPAPNLNSVFLDVEDNRLFREFRSGDLKAEDWRRPSALERTLKQIASFLYY